jgi:hypothetical protein
MISNRSLSFKEGFLTLIVLILVLGSLAIAVIDPGFRPAFADLAKVAMAGYLGWMMPRSSKGN